MLCTLEKVALATELLPPSLRYPIVLVSVKFFQFEYLLINKNITGCCHLNCKKEICFDTQANLEQHEEIQIYVLM